MEETDFRRDVIDPGPFLGLREGCVPADDLEQERMERIYYKR